MCLRTSTTLYLGVSNRIHCIYFDPTWSKSKRKNNANIKCFLFFFFCLAKCGTPYKSGVSFKLHVCTCCARCKRRTYSVGMVFVFFFSYYYCTVRCGICVSLSLVQTVQRQQQQQQQRNTTSKRS